MPRRRTYPSLAPQRPTRRLPWRFILDTLAILLWGILLLRFWVTGRINVLLHPSYVWLAVVAGVFLAALGVFRLIQAFGQRQHERLTADTLQTQHFNLFPPGWSSALLVAVAVFGMQFSPQAFASQVALDRGVTDTLAMTRSQPQSFRSGTRPEERTLIDWVRTLSVYPEPDAYQGLPAKVEGFVIHPTELPNNYLMLARFVITCCAADVYPVALPVKLEGDRATYNPDQWFRVEGEMITETLNGKRQLVIQARQLSSIPEPEVPYAY